MRKSRGFTLIEVMIALTLLSMIMVAIIAAMRAFGNTKATIEQVTNRVDEVRVVSQFLRNSIGAAMPVLREGTGDGAVEQAAAGTYFAGGSAQLTWVSPLVGGVSLGGAYVMHLEQVEKQLKLTWHPYDPDVEAATSVELEPRVLLDSVDVFEVGYLAAYGEDWTEEWPGERANPVAVRLNIKAAEKYWPELVIRLSGAGLNAQ